MTGDYAMTLAVMIAVVIAAVIVNETFGRSMYVMKLEHRGINLKAGRELGLMKSIPIADLMRTQFATVRPGAGLGQVVDALRGAPYGMVFVTDENDALFGIITVTDLAPVADSVAQPGLPVIAADVANSKPLVLEADDNPHRALRLMEISPWSHLPVVRDKASMRLVGVVDIHDLVLAYHRALLQARAEERGDRRKARPRRRIVPAAVTAVVPPPGPAPVIDPDPGEALEPARRT